MKDEQVGCAFILVLLWLMFTVGFRLGAEYGYGKAQKACPCVEVSE